MFKLRNITFAIFALLQSTSIYGYYEVAYKIKYQKTIDGFPQHLAYYNHAVICTNLAGPRKDVQMIELDTGAIDMCHKCTHHKKRTTHKYSWVEVNTYADHQSISW